METNTLSQSVTSYWTNHTIIQDSGMKTPEDSLNYLDWRNRCYLGYLESMPLDQARDQVVLDYGCGLGHDLVGFCHFSQPKKIFGMDVSSTALGIAAQRLNLHGFQADLIQLNEGQPLPLPDHSVDLIHSSGVIHHSSDPELILREFRRILKPSGSAQIMVYHTDSVWMHLYVAYYYKVKREEFKDLPLHEVFKASTDGKDCPISKSYTIEEFQALAARAGFDSSFNGSSVSIEPEMLYLPRRFEAMMHRELNSESRKFLYELRFDDQGLPIWNNRVAGINIAFRLKPRV